MKIKVTVDDPNGSDIPLTIWDITFDNGTGINTPIPQQVLDRLAAPNANPVIVIVDAI